MVKRIVQAMVVIAAVVGMVGVIQSNKASAVVTVVDKVQICHRDNNVNQPYGPFKDEVSVSSIFSNHGHDEHDGPVATSVAVAQALKNNHQNWGDVIPPFYYMTQGPNSHLAHYDGKNWTTSGQAIWNNDCQYVVAPEGKTSYLLACEKITLNAPTGIKPVGAMYQYYIDGVAAGVGSKTVTPGNHTITLKVNGVLVDTDVVNVEKCKEEKPEGKSHFKTYCEAIFLKAPLSVEPEDATYQYYIDGKPAELGMNDVSKGWHVVTLKVNGKLVDLDFTYVKECEDEQKPAVVTVSVTCNPLTNLFTFTIKNDGEATAEIMFNAETFDLKGGDSTTRDLAGGQTLTLKVDGVIYESEACEKYDNKVFVSCQGQGSTEVPVTPAGGQGAATGVASLPYTGSAGAQIASLIALVASVATAIGGYVLRNRAASTL